MELDLIRMGRRVAGKRVERGWSQQELAARAQTSQRTVAWIELGKQPRVSVPVLVNIAEALDVSLEYLVYGTGSTSDDEPAEADTVAGQDRLGRLRIPGENACVQYADITA